MNCDSNDQQSKLDGNLQRLTLNTQNVCPSLHKQWESLDDATNIASWKLECSHTRTIFPGQGPLYLDWMKLVRKEYIWKCMWIYLKESAVFSKYFSNLCPRDSDKPLICINQWHVWLRTVCYSNAFLDRIHGSILQLQQLICCPTDCHCSLCLFQHNLWMAPAWWNKVCHQQAPLNHLVLFFSRHASQTGLILGLFFKIKQWRRSKSYHD